MLCVLLIAVAGSRAVAQDPVGGEFLRKLGEAEKSAISDQFALEIAQLEYFAKPGRIEIYGYDTAVLAIDGASFTFTPLGGAPLTITSHRMWRGPDGTRRLARWRGTARSASSSRPFPVKWQFFVQWIDAQGNVVSPDVNWSVAHSDLEQDARTVLVDSYDGPHENLTLVYSLAFVNNRINYPPSGGKLAIHGLGDGIDYVLIYEIDPEKVLAPRDDSPVNPVPLSPEQSRRWADYRRHINEVNRRFGMEEVPE